MARNLKLKTYTDANGKYRWRAFAGNGEQLARSPRGYEKRSKMVNDLNFILSAPHEAELYKAGDGWRWRFSREVVEDGKKLVRKVAMASEGVENRVDCKNSSDLFLDAQPI